MKFNKTYALMAILLISIMTVSSVIAFNRTSKTQQFNPDITTTLKLTVTHNGQNTTRVMHDDAILDNFNQWIQGLLLNFASSYTFNTLVDTSGTSRTIEYYCANQCGNTYSFNLVSGGTAGGQIYLGTGTKTISRQINSIQTQYGSVFNDASSVCNSGTPDTIVVSGSESAPSTASITEAAFSVNLYVQSVSLKTFLFTYETFTAVPVTNGDTISVQYTFNLNNAGVNRNLCNAFAIFFLTTSTQDYWTAYDTSNVSWPMCAYITVSVPPHPCGYPYPYNSGWFAFQAEGNPSAIVNGAGLYVCQDAGTINNMGIWMGTGTTTFGFTTSGLTAPVGTNPTTISATNFNSGLATSFVFITENSFNPASTTSVTESGLFIGRTARTFSNSGCSTGDSGVLNHWFLLLGFSFSPAISMPSGQNNALTFQISD